MDFGHLLVERGLISPQELQEALALQRRAIVEGRAPVPRLGELLVERGFLTERQVAEALEEQNKEILYCPRCDIQLNVERRADAAGYRCGQCGGDLMRVPEVKNVRVADTSVILVSKEPQPSEVRMATQDPARKLGKYILLDELGRGGAAVVHRAWDTYLNQYVALKFLRPARDGEDEERHDVRIMDLLKEARSAIKLRHPNIVPVYDVGRIDRQFYIAMECLEGRPLSSLLRKVKNGRISPFYDEPRKYLAALRDVAKAVHYAHTRLPAVIHCDLKPSNIFIDGRWKPWVLDFGLARKVSGPDSGDGDAGPSIRGTPAYMAPEQVIGESGGIDARTDVYGLGAILYELMTGHPPFSGDMVDVLRRALNDPPAAPGTEVSLEDVPLGRPGDRPLLKPLERLCLRTLDKEKGKRPQTAREFADEIDRLLRGADDDTVITPATSRRVSGTARLMASSVLVRTAYRMDRGFRWMRSHPLLLTGGGALALALSMIVLSGQRQTPRGMTSDEILHAKMAALQQEVDGLVGALKLEQAQKAYVKAQALLPLERRPLLDGPQEDVEWVQRMHGHLVEVLNTSGRYRQSVFRLRDRDLRAIEILRATPEKLVLYHEDGTLEVAWSSVSPDTVSQLARELLAGGSGARPADRLGLAIYCAKNGLADQARTHLEALRSTDLEVVARRYLGRLDRRPP